MKRLIVLTISIVIIVGIGLSSPSYGDVSVRGNCEIAKARMQAIIDFIAAGGSETGIVLNCISGSGTLATTAADGSEVETHGKYSLCEKLVYTTPEGMPAGWYVTRIFKKIQGKDEVILLEDLIPVTIQEGGAGIDLPEPTFSNGNIIIWYYPWLDRNWVQVFAYPWTPPLIGYEPALSAEDLETFQMLCDVLGWSYEFKEASPE